MSNVSLLDCTLRDGGYINDWEFGHNNLISIYERLALAGADIIEVGFIDDRRPFDINRSIFPNTESIAAIYDSVNNKPAMAVAMIDYGTCAIDNIARCEASFVDGIRVIFKKHRMVEAMDYCQKIKNLGYKVFVQLVSITSYEEDDIKSLCDIANNIEPYAVSIVDTYGLLYPDTTIKYANWLDKYLNAGIALGFHAHNNLQLGYANALTFYNYATDRDKVIDGTIHGMGKSAGNAPIELLMPYLNTNSDKKYLVNHVLEAYEESLSSIYEKSSWGYSELFYTSSEQKCHPSYVSYLKNKDNLSINDMNNILSNIGMGDIRLLYDREHIENLYEEYIVSRFDDDTESNRLADVIGNREVLIVGPGKNIDLQRDRVEEYIRTNNPMIISINYIPDTIDIDYVFITKRSRYQELSEEIHKKTDVKIIRTSDVDTREEAAFVFLKEPLLEQREEIKDNSFLMLLGVLKRAGLMKISCAGLDGYSDTEDNYYKQNMEYNFIKSVARRLNYHIREMLHTEYKNMDIRFVTYSHYDQVEDANSGGF